jgi:hypothetical protein
VPTGPKPAQRSRRRQQQRCRAHPEPQAKIRDIVGLYLNPPAAAIVSCVDELGRAGASTPLPASRFHSPPAEPDVRSSTHPALHEVMPGLSG